MTLDKTAITFGKYLRELRTKRHLGTNQLAKLAGINAGTISRFEKGERKNPNVTVLRKLSKTLKVSLEDLLNAAYPMPYMEIEKQREAAISDQKPKHNYLLPQKNSTPQEIKVIEYLREEIEKGKIPLSEQERLLHLVKAFIESGKVG